MEKTIKEPEVNTYMWNFFKADENISEAQTETTKKLCDLLTKEGFAFDVDVVLMKQNIGGYVDQWKQPVITISSPVKIKLYIDNVNVETNGECWVSNGFPVELKYKINIWKYDLEKIIEAIKVIIEKEGKGFDNTQSNKIEMEFNGYE